MPAHAARPLRPEPVGAHDILERLEGVRASGSDRWMARCPAHGDRTASLSVRLGDDGRVLLHCFSGCEFREIVEALDLRPEQLFPPSDRPFVPRPRPDPDLAARALLERLRTLRTPPPPGRMRDELRILGLLLAGGTRAFCELPANFTASRFQTFALRVLFEAVAVLAAQGTPRRWFSPVALAAEIDRWGGAGYARRLGTFLWARTAVGIARGDT
jgi:hypothetical protein